MGDDKDHDDSCPVYSSFGYVDCKQVLRWKWEII
jgi:hypothetical protein